MKRITKCLECGRSIIDECVCQEKFEDIDNMHDHLKYIALRKDFKEVELPCFDKDDNKTEIVKIDFEVFENALELRDLYANAMIAVDEDKKSLLIHVNKLSTDDNRFTLKLSIIRNK